LESVAHYKEVLLVLGTAGLLVPLMMRWRISSILGYLIVGILLGPDIMGKLADTVPLLLPLAFSRQSDFSYLAELGVVFLLFLIGLELSLERLKTMRRLVFGLGALQVVATLLFLVGVAVMLGYEDNMPLLLGMALSLSSTAIVIQLYSDTKRLGSQSGRVSFSILLMQDLAVIPMLMLLGLIAGKSEGSLAAGIVQALVQAVFAILFIILVGRFALRPFLKLVAATKSADLFMAAVLFIAVGTGALANFAGLSMSLGAFIAGLMLAETEYRRAIEAIIEPFKGILLGAFFLLIGLGLDLQVLAEHPLPMIGGTVVLIAAKALIIYGLARTFKVPHRAAMESALLLGPCGEFAFVLIATAKATGIANAAETTGPLLIVTLSMMLIPLMSWLTARIRSQQSTPSQPVLPADMPDDLTGHVIIAGFGRVGTLVASMLDEHKIPFLAIDGDVNLVEKQRKTGLKVYFGDATNIAFLKTCGLASARALAITMDNPARADEIVRSARAEQPNIKIVVRARDERHAMRLYESGATEAVPETIESSLQLGEALLVESGVPMGLAIASVHERRDGFRKLLGRPNRREMVKTARSRLKLRMPK
jgi:monovalent cation:proton antiporter-2 (CPA2) family protein